MFDSERQQCGINQSHTPLDVTMKILLWHHLFPYFKIDFNFIWKHTDVMFFEKLWEKNNPSWVNSCGMGKSHPRGWIFWPRTRLTPDQNIQLSGEIFLSHIDTHEILRVFTFPQLLSFLPRPSSLPVLGQPPITPDSVSANLECLYKTNK